MFKIDFDSTKIEQALKNKIKQVEQAEQGVVKDLGSIVKKNARKFVPVDEGDLKKSLDMTLTDNGKVAEIGTTLDYGRYQEYGTRKMPPQPFLRPALDVARKSVKGVIKKYVK